MPILVDWLYEDKIILTVVVGNLSKVDIDVFFEKILGMLESSTQHKVMTLVDMRRLGDRSVDVNMQDMKRMAELARHPRIGWNLMVSEDRVSNFITGTVMKLSGNLFKVYQKPQPLLETAATLMPDASAVLTTTQLSEHIERMLAEHDNQMQL